eukprot:TRINITY_DN8254_c0_g1_i1.p1 TRINITY_DN8254_c0_g1~~TRINITY_DN8254_c0_g1_i1.p1  ORF type:complete len:238 (-),score=26.89 TRINITY_DN8254_c0_g1_i1:117-749(-)
MAIKTQTTWTMQDKVGRTLSDATTTSASSISGWSFLADSEASTPRSDKGATPSLPFAYPVALVVRNTFLDFSTSKSATATVLQRRRVRSCEPPQRKTNHQEETGSISNIGVGDIGVEVAFKPMAIDGSPSSEQLRNLPSAGSAGHYVGDCRPCAFFWKARGCTNGERCEFCHVCDPLEKRRRRNAKKAMLKAQAAQAVEDEAEDVASTSP